MRFTWNYTDDTSCKCDPDRACDPCMRREAYMVDILVTAPSEAAAREVGSVNGSSWEFPSDGQPYVKTSVFANDDVDSILRKDGIEDAEETS